jgi:hypothetical protein
LDSEREQLNVSVSSESENPRARKRVRRNMKDEIGQELVKFMKARAEPVQRDEDELFMQSLVPALKRVSNQNKMACKMAIMKVINDFEVVSGGQTSQFCRNQQWQNERGSLQFSGASVSQTEAQLYGGQTTEMAWRSFSDAVPSAEPTAYSYGLTPL